MNIEEIREKGKAAPLYEEQIDGNGDKFNIVAEFEGVYAEGCNGYYEVKHAKVRLFDSGTFSLFEDSNMKFKNGCWFNYEIAKKDGTLV